jgi:hypothetical protein
MAGEEARPPGEFEVVHAGSHGEHVLTHMPCGADVAGIDPDGHSLSRLNEQAAAHRCNQPPPNRGGSTMTEHREHRSPGSPA